MPLPREEIETVIRLGYYDEECVVTTSDPKVKRFMEKNGLTASNVSRVACKWEEVQVKRDGEMVTEKGKPIEWDEVTWTFKAPAEWFRLPKQKKKVSDKQRAAAAERFRKARTADDDEDGDDDGED